MCIAAFILNLAMALNPSKGLIGLIGGLLALAAPIDWVIVFTQVIGPVYMKTTGFHYRYIVTSWGIGMFVSAAAGIAGIFLYILKAYEYRLARSLSDSERVSRRT